MQAKVEFYSSNYVLPNYANPQLENEILRTAK